MSPKESPVVSNTLYLTESRLFVDHFGLLGIRATVLIKCTVDGRYCTDKHVLIKRKSMWICLSVKDVGLSWWIVFVLGQLVSVCFTKTTKVALIWSNIQWNFINKVIWFRQTTPVLQIPFLCFGSFTQLIHHFLFILSLFWRHKVMKWFQSPLTSQQTSVISKRFQIQTFLYIIETYIYTQDAI